jgi:exopolyphosphatase/pppGpp-phosphohydrolase
VIDRVRELTGLNLHEVLSEEAIQTAIRCLDSLRKRFPEVSELDEPRP